MSYFNDTELVGGAIGETEIWIDDLDTMTVAELKAIADEIGVEYTSKTLKAELKEAIIVKLQGEAGQ